MKDILSPRGFTASSETCRARLRAWLSSESVAKASPRAFTLIELLVVISIIGILSSVVMVSINNARVTSRNSQRLSVVVQYKIALEQVYDAARKYPDPLTSYSCLGSYPGNTCWASNVSNSTTLDASLASYVMGKPTPITTNLPYTGILYYKTSDSTYYLLWFLEGVNRSCTPGAVYSDYSNMGITYCILNS